MVQLMLEVVQLGSKEQLVQTATGAAGLAALAVIPGVLVNHHLLLVLLLHIQRVRQAVRLTLALLIQATEEAEAQVLTLAVMLEVQGS
jgi:hypothetical protein